MRLPNSSWPRKALKTILNAPYQSEWYRQVLEGRERINFVPSDVMNWKANLKQSWLKSEVMKWREEQSLLVSLSHYPKLFDGVREKFLDGTPASRFFCQLRIGDVRSLHPKNRECEVCGSAYKEPTQHAILECPAWARERGTLASLTEVNRCTERDHIVNVYRIWRQWKAAQKVETAE
jgi:hypothetical protein